MTNTPGPPPGPPNGPPGQPPWGYGYGPPPRPSRAPGIIGGIAIGGVAAVIVPIASLGAIESVGVAALVVAILIVPAVGIALMISGPTRPWGLGILIGWAIALIIVGGACVALIAALSNAEASP